MVPLITSMLTLIVGVLVGYLTGYAKKKGENLATHEDIGKLTEQVAAVTRTAKEIEAQITSGLWDRQKRWELKREVLFEATQRVAEAEFALLMLDSVLQVEVDRQNKVDAGLLQESNKYLLRWNSAWAALDESRLFVDNVCGQGTKSAFNEFGKLAKATATAISKKDKDAYLKALPDMTAKRIAVGAEIRKELGIDALNQPPPAGSV